MRRIICSISFLFTLAISQAQTNFQKDFEYYLKTIEDNFAYFTRQKTNWVSVREIYQPIADTITEKNSFIHLLETINNELYNGHVFLNTNTPSSNRTIPTGADLKVSWINKQFVITELREGYNADLCGLKTGMTITQYNGMNIDDAVNKLLPRSVTVYDKEMYEYAGNLLLAGTHDKKRVLTTSLKGIQQLFNPDSIPNKTEEDQKLLLESMIQPGNIGYIRINNSLGNTDLIQAFDLALDQMFSTKGLILDLRETPSGGTTTIARAIMGRFAEKEMTYQKHIYTAEEKETGIRRSTLEMVSPRQKLYRKPLVILVGYWTGSMGEGMAIGFDGMKRAKIVGTKMAGLLGEIYTFEMPGTRIPFSFPSVQLKHINGQPREDFMPGVLIKDPKQTIRIALSLFK